MSEKFDEAFKAALHALCIEHGVSLSVGDDCYDGYALLRVHEAYEKEPAGCWLEDYEIKCVPAPTPKEIAALEAAAEEHRVRTAAWEARRMASHAQYAADEEKRIAVLKASGDYMQLQTAVEAHAQEQRKKQMRVSTDPTDPAYIDARPRRAWCNDVLIEGWTVADEFRRCVITADGKVHQGSVLIERIGDEVEPVVAAPARVRRRAWTLEEDKNGTSTHMEQDVVLSAAEWRELTAAAAAAAPAKAADAPAAEPLTFPPIDAGFVGVFEPVPDAPPAAAPVAEPAAAEPVAPAAPAQKTGKRRK